MNPRVQQETLPKWSTPKTSPLTLKAPCHTNMTQSTKKITLGSPFWKWPCPRPSQSSLCLEMAAKKPQIQGLTRVRESPHQDATSKRTNLSRIALINKWTRILWTTSIWLVARLLTTKQDDSSVDLRLNLHCSKCTRNSPSIVLEMTSALLAHTVNVTRNLTHHCKKILVIWWVIASLSFKNWEAGEVVGTHPWKLSVDWVAEDLQDPNLPTIWVKSRKVENRALQELTRKV